MAAADRNGQVQLDLQIELGRAHLEPSEVEQLASGSLVVLQQPADEPVDVFVDGRLVARGQLLVLNEKFCIRITELSARESLPIAA